MSKTKAGPIAAERLKSFIERIEKLLEERHAIQSDIRDVFAEAKGVGYDVKTMRSLIKLRTMDAADRDEQEALLDTYAHALGIETSGRIIAITSSEDDLIDHATKIVREVDRCLTLPRDPLPTIRHIMEEIDCSSGKAHKLRRLVEERLETMEKFSRSIERTVKNENENPPTADRLPPGDATGTVVTSSPALGVAKPIQGFCGVGESRPEGHDQSDPERPLAAARIAGLAPGLQEPIQDAAGRAPGKGEANDAPIDLRVSEADRRADRQDGPRPGGGESLQRRAGFGIAGRTGQDLRDPGAPLECDVGERGDHSAAGRDAASVAPARDAAPRGCVDGASGLTPPEPAVPPFATPQAGGVPPLPVTPAPDGGVGAGTLYQRITGSFFPAPSVAKPSQPVKEPANAGGSDDGGLTTLRQEVARAVPPAPSPTVPVGATASQPEPVPNPDDDKLEIPVFLRGRGVATRADDGATAPIATAEGVS